ncbi:MAG: cytochrome c biogenesis protein CcsA [Flavobacteriales bacterium]|nr:cytochrome c biogenesis protein CcsA [Flavobacteriales bacterium]
MGPIAYVGEHSWAGPLGHVLTIVSFVMAGLAFAGFLMQARTDDASWRRIGRMAFRVHTLAVLGIVVTLFIMLFNHWFEYDYVWKHSNRAMPMRYILSCFWEGQEGSFLLWTFWNVVLGNVLILRAKEWEGHVMTVVALVQVFLATMLLGLYVGDIRVGSSPFLLVRQLPENLGLPWTQIPDYLARIPQFQDGRGLNPLLQNYWMVIHPPTLFLGFASTMVPFAYAIAGLWRRRLREWITPALPYAYFGVMVLGTGVLMGGAWAYEALSFGGFWAWDPVENASLVPWLTLVGAAHLMIVNKRKPTSLFSTFFFTLLTFHLVLYSTFLTRSGVLGDTSVHSFTGDGMLPGLTLFMLFFVAFAVFFLMRDVRSRRFYLIVSAALLVIGVALQVQVMAILLFLLISGWYTLRAYRRDFDKPEQEESVWSREFWLFIGALVLLLSATQVTFSTSVPVFNLLIAPFQQPLHALADGMHSGWLQRIAEAKLAPPTEAKAHYNKWQIPFAFLVALLVAVVQYMRYKDTDMKKFRRNMLWSFLGAVAVTVVLTLLLGYQLREMNLIALLFATTFAVLANAAYIWIGLKGKWSGTGGSIAHVGFSLVLLGALISTSRQAEISRNGGRMDLRFLSKDLDNGTDILLYRGDTVPMGNFFVHYRGKRQDGVNLHYEVDYFTQEPEHYAKGDTVRVSDVLFTAVDDHTAGRTFIADQPDHWREMEDYPRRALWHAHGWRPFRPGPKQFTLEPLVQLNPRFGNVAEPSTHHWLDRDLYTHVRYADLNVPEVGDTAQFHYMPARTYEKQIGDTIVTPSCLVVLDSMRTVQDSMTIRMLGPDFDVHVLHMRVRDLYDPHRWFQAAPVIIYRDGQPVAAKGFELPPLRVRFDLSSVQGRKIGLDVAEQEYIVMQAIVFPGINILWIGCILMFLGTLLAVRQRIRRERRT